MRSVVYVLDSFAVLAYLQDEEGAELVHELLRKAARRDVQLQLSVVNLGEVYYTVARSRGEQSAEEIVAVVEQLPIEVIDADRSLTIEAAMLKARYRFSYADAFAAGLARARNGVLVSGDSEFNQLEPEVSILWLRRS
ncbi:MAG: type II toxin-antitoxin system VapC family toxin [Firmicutes bacterium]|nr:type II toxin-antitoxin system VapC family toxin [Bacillota bacterium]